jgi:hypothetical protein
MTTMDDSKIPTPAELFTDATAAHNREADEIVGWIVGALRHDPTRSVYRPGSRAALEVVKRRMEARGWVCKIFSGDQRDPETSITVCAPTVLK